MGIDKFISNTSKENIFHSNGLAKVRDGDALGSASAETFNKRSQINRGRQTIRRYTDSMVGQMHMRGSSSRPQLDAHNPIERSDPHASRHNALGSMPNIPPRSFKEPPTRGFNPYS